MADIDSGRDKNFTFGIMKTNCWLILVTMIAAGAIAQDTNTLPPIPLPVTAPPAEVAPAVVETNTPAAKPANHKAKKRVAAPKKIAFVEPTVTLVPGPAEVAVKNLNVRGQAGLRGDVITHVTRGEAVTVLSQMNLDKHKVNEPAQWAKISLPAKAQAWVHSMFIDPTNKTVLPKKLNLRAGPGENYSVLGLIERGTVVNEIITKGEWTQIEPPTNAYAFVAAMYLKQEASGTLGTNAPPSTETEPMTTNNVAEPQPLVTESTNAAPEVVESNAPPAMETNAVPAAEVDTNLPPPPPRVVTHEGVVRHVTSLIEPTAYELYDPNTRQDINYLYTTETNLDLGRYNGFQIVVTGEEGLSERWKNTPVLTIQSIIVISTNVFTPPHAVSPRDQSH
jgi:uncharacterized protein YgiM (DUF1202 family)